MQALDDDFLDFFEDSQEEEEREEEEKDEGDEGKEKKETSVLDLYGTDITKLARQGRLDDCFGREKELAELMEVLVRRQKNNPVLVGDAGVGKSAIVELFASKLVNNLVPFVLEGRSIISLDLARIVAGSRYRGEFEARFRKILDEAIAQPNLIIFIDEIHTLSGTGSAEGSLDAANMLKPILARNGFQCIGATTTKEYEQIERDPALHRRFQPIVVKQPSVDETVAILYSLRPGLESFHNLEFSPGAFRTAAELSHRYINDRFLPDKAIDLIDRTAAREVVELTSPRENSIVGAIVNGALRQIGRFKNEAFRRGDIASQFIFQELENAYRNFLFTWVDNPRQIPLNAKAYNKKTKGKLLRSPISQELFDKMRFAVLTRTEELLFASSRPRYEVKKIKQLTNLSSDKASFVLSNFFYYLDTLEEILESSNENKLFYLFKITSFYRISLSVFSIYRTFEKKVEPVRSSISELDNISNEKVYEKAYYYFLHNNKIKKHASSNQISGRLNLLLTKLKNFSKNYGFLSYIRKFRHFNKKTTQPIIKNFDFFRLDVEHIEETFEYLSELETIETSVIQNFLTELRPVMRKALVQSFRSTSAFEITDQQLNSIYQLLGYYSTDTGKNFLYSLNEPEVLNDARKKGNLAGLKKRVGPGEIKKVLSYITGIPIESISSAEQVKLLNLEKILHERVIGQEDAISAISRAIRRSRLGIQNPNRPIASFFFCGPTGVGKTEVCKALAYTLFGSEKEMIRFDMSEFMEKFTVSRLIGSPPGYIGYEEGGQLSDAVRKKPYSVVLFDEVEKAHPDVLNILLQILEDGRLTDTQKRLISFENTVIIMTSNVGAGEIQDFLKENPDDEVETEPSELSNSKNTNPFIYENKKGYQYLDPYLGTVQFLKSPIKENFLADLQEEIDQQFKDSFKNLPDYRVYQRRVIKQIEKKIGKKLDPEVKSSLIKAKESDQPLKITKQVAEEKKNTLKSVVLQKLGEFFLPEFLNRLDDIIVFKPLRPSELRQICDFMVDDVVKRMRQKNIIITVDNSVKKKVSKEGYNPAFGARPLRRLITKYVEDLVSENVLKSEQFQNKTLRLNVRLDDMNQIFVFNPDIIDNRSKKLLSENENIIDVLPETTPKILSTEVEDVQDFIFKNRDVEKLLNSSKSMDNAFIKSLKTNALNEFSTISPPSVSDIKQFQIEEENTEQQQKFFDIYQIFKEIKFSKNIQEISNSIDSLVNSNNENKSDIFDTNTNKIKESNFEEKTWKIKPERFIEEDSKKSQKIEKQKELVSS
jgi:ATP-dependent Clp protease ATP-binding subunit ClpA